MKPERTVLPLGCVLVMCVLAAVSLRAQVTISSPENGGTVSSPVPLNAALSVAQPSSMTVYDNGSPVFQQQSVSSIGTLLALNAGTHLITVKATKANGQVSSASTAIAVTSAEPYAPVSAGMVIASDMSGKNEGLPQGVPLSYAWATGPATVMGNNPGAWRAMTAWGVVYVASQGSPAVNTRVNIRNVQAYVLRKSTGKWLLLQSTGTPDGGAYPADFSINAGGRGDRRTEPDGTISVTAGEGYNYHFYPSVRGAIDPDDIGGIVTLFQARLIVSNIALPDDRSIAAYLAGSGGDYYPALTGHWPGSLPYNPGIAIGKEKYVRTFWRVFSMTTMTAAQLQKNPPPIDLTGVEP
jgi:hypothetical protein